LGSLTIGSGVSTSNIHSVYGVAVNNIGLNSFYTGAVSKPVNIIGNPDFQGGLHGFQSSQLSSYSPIEEKVNTRGRGSALRFNRSSSGAGGGTMGEFYNWTELADLLSGQTVNIGFWAYPSAGYTTNCPLSIGLRYNDASGLRTCSITLDTHDANGLDIANRWSFLGAQTTVHELVNPTAMGLYVYGGAWQSGQYFLLNGLCISIDEGNGTSVFDYMMRGEWDYHKLACNKTEGPFIIVYGSGYPTENSITWLPGDRVWNTIPIAGATTEMGWVCTASGAPGTWNGFGNIEA